ncbi:MAG: N-acetylgalactosamine 6-sulfate sulfatase (GALNS) [Lentisphaerae bacterium]|nr:N-acetylgalactosamine 6-sulfate sulfatase (GALNS) [Lentisphaerota bacterium]
MKDFFRSVARWAGLALLVTAARAAAAPARPNIVFIYADDLGYGDPACYGHPHILTPHLDRMAREGILFRDFTVVNPVCSPSRTGIMTGQFPSRWGVHQHFATHEQNVARGMPDWLDPAAPLLSRMLKEAGYRTAHYGKWHLSGGGTDGAPLPAAYGFDDAAVWTGPGRHVFDGTDRRSDDQAGAAHDKEAASWLSVAATDHAVRFIRESKGVPFYINLWLPEAHHLVSATDEDKKPYPDTPEPQRTYYAAVTRADRQVGRILDVLDELGLSTNTLVMFSSDNGPENSHPNPGQKFYYSVGSTGGLRGRKRSLLLGGVNVPFLARWPGTVPAGRVDRETALSGVDVLPTVLAATGVAAPAGYAGDGQDMLAAFRGESQPRAKPLFWWWQGGHGGDDWPAFAMRDGPWMLVLDETKRRAELHRVDGDRAQARNLAAEEGPRVERMKAAIDAWFAGLRKDIDPRLQARAEPRSARAAPSTAGADATPGPAPDRARAFTTWDKDKDGVLSPAEYKAGLSDKTRADPRFRAFDMNGDGRLTREEFVGPSAAPETR